MHWKHIFHECTHTPMHKPGCLTLWLISHLAEAQLCSSSSSSSPFLPTNYHHQWRRRKKKKEKQSRWCRPWIKKLNQSMTASSCLIMNHASWPQHPMTTTMVQCHFYPLTAACRRLCPFGLQEAASLRLRKASRTVQMSDPTPGDSSCTSTY